MASTLYDTCCLGERRSSRMLRFTTPQKGEKGHKARISRKTTKMCLLWRDLAGGRGGEWWKVKAVVLGRI